MMRVMRFDSVEHNLKRERATRRDVERKKRETEPRGEKDLHKSFSPGSSYRDVSA